MKKELSVFEASCIITGYGVGSGVLAMPYLVQQCGLPVAISMLILALGISYVLHLMLADLTIKKGNSGDTVRLITDCFPEGKQKKWLTFVLFFLLAFILYSNLAIYICEVAEILCSILGGSILLYKIGFYIVAAIMGAFDIKILGLSEKYTILGIVAIETSLFVGALWNIRNPMPLVPENFRSVLSFFSLGMFAFIAMFSVPQIVTGLKKDEKKIRRSIFFGMLMNFILAMVVIVSSILASPTVTEVSILGLGEGIGNWAKILGSIFTILIMLTSYWAISLSLGDMVSGTFPINKKFAFLVASLPSILIALIPSKTFVEFLRYTSGGIAILTVLFILPLFHIHRKEGSSILGRYGSVTMEVVVFLGYVAMAIGSMI